MGDMSYFVDVLKGGFNRPSLGNFLAKEFATEMGNQIRNILKDVVIPHSPHEKTNGKTILVQDDYDKYPKLIDLAGKTIEQVDSEFGHIEYWLNIGDIKLEFKTPEKRAKVWSAILEIIRPIDLTDSMDLGQDEKIG